MDEADISSIKEEFERQKKIAEIQSEKQVAKYKGFCLNCGEETKYPRRWCCVECRNDWEKKNHV